MELGEAPLVPSCGSRLTLLGAGGHDAYLDLVLSRQFAQSRRHCAEVGQRHLTIEIRKLACKSISQFREKCTQRHVVSPFGGSAAADFRAAKNGNL